MCVCVGICVPVCIRHRSSQTDGLILMQFLSLKGDLIEMVIS